MRVIKRYDIDGRFEETREGDFVRYADICHRITQLETELAEAPAQANVNEQSQAQQTESKWNQIETAPKDGSEVILMVKSRAGISKGFLVGHYMQGGHCIEDHPPIDSGWYFWNGRMFDKASEPTHWMPLPPAPEGGDK